jgi:TrmH family RNA methyltransferase
LKKLIKSLHQKQFRDQNGLFIAEGEKLAFELVKSDYVAELILIKDSPSSDVIEVVNKYADKGVPVYTAPKHQFDQVCDTKSPQSILIVINIKEMELKPDLPFIALDGISDPGNVGTIIRTADWFGFKQVILGRDCADLYNPKTVRATMGSIFRMNTVYNPELGELLKEEYKKFNIYGASAHSDKSITGFKPKKNFGLVFGSESHGITEDIEKQLTHQFKIDGADSAESLNVAVAAGISLYHFSRNME